jgi:hypothetical protein
LPDQRHLITVDTEKLPENELGFDDRFPAGLNKVTVRIEDPPALVRFPLRQDLPRFA